MDRKTFGAILQQVVKLPAGIQFFEVDGEIIFPIRSNDAGLAADSILYLVKPGNPDGTGWYKYGIFLSKLFEPYTKELLKKITKAEQTFNPDGGDLGLEG